MGSLLSQLYMISSYGLFAVMTTYRDVIVIEGTTAEDNEKWVHIPFKYQTGNVNEISSKILFLGHLPRLDWMLWFLPLDFRFTSGIHVYSWFRRLVRLIQQGEPCVYRLLGNNMPFSPANPPSRIRVLLYRYEFARFSLRKGPYWVRWNKGLISY